LNLNNVKKFYVGIFVFLFLYKSHIFRNSSLNFVGLSWGRITDKLVIILLLTGKVLLKFDFISSLL